MRDKIVTVEIAVKTTLNDIMLKSVFGYILQDLAIFHIKKPEGEITGITYKIEIEDRKE